MALFGGRENMTAPALCRAILGPEQVNFFLNPALPPGVGALHQRRRARPHRRAPRARHGLSQAEIRMAHGRPVSLSTHDAVALTAPGEEAAGQRWRLCRAYLIEPTVRRRNPAPVIIAQG